MKNIVIDFRMHKSSGIGTYIRNIVSYLINFFDITLIGNEKEIKKYEFSNKVRIINLNSPIYSIEEQIKLPFKIPKCDIFWSPHYNIPILPIKAKKRIVTIHDVCHLAFKNQLSILQKVYAEFVVNLAVRLSDVIFTVSEFSKSEILKYTSTRKDIKVIYNGIDTSFFKPEERAKKENYILYVGNVKPHKNLARALKAFSLLKVDDGIKFKIVGEKDNFITKDTGVDEIAKKLGDKVKFTGYVSDEELKILYQKAKLFIFPSLYEGFGIPPLEAMACGCPCVVSNAASLPEVCGDAAYYVNPYDVEDIAKGIEKVLTDENLRKDLIRKGFENIKRFSWEKSAQKIIEIIENL